MEYEDFLQSESYNLGKDTKHVELTAILKELTMEHFEKCPEYRNILKMNGIKSRADIEDICSYEDIPFLPVRLFKEYELKSVPDEQIVKTMTSSGTSGQAVSKIFLDRRTSSDQTRVMTRIVSDFIGKKRLPMIIIDTIAILKDRTMFSARGAGILGFSMFGRDRMYALDENMELDLNGLIEFLREHDGENVFLFGFTFMIWQHFYKKLLEIPQEERPDLSKGILIHGGGWKKLQAEAVSSEKFKSELQEVCGIDPSRIYSYYGMVEQTGTIYMECQSGHLHASSFSDVIVRNPDDWSVCLQGQKGVIEVVSAIPRSYPGHVLLTEDEGIIDGEDDCPCGRKGKYFHVLGRIKNAEIRGCSDTYAGNFANGR